MQPLLAEDPAATSAQNTTPAETPRAEDDPEPNWWTKLFAPFKDRARERYYEAMTKPVTIRIVVDSSDGDTLKAHHVLTADLPPMTVNSVVAHLKIGGNDTVQEMDLRVE